MSSPGAIIFSIPVFGPVRWYGVLLAAALLFGVWLAKRQAKREGLRANSIKKMGTAALMWAIVGARLWEVVFAWDYYGRHPWKIPAIEEGGFAIHGALIAGALVVVWLAPVWRLSAPHVLDVAAPSIVLGQAIGRWGNFFNEEAFGQPTDLPWRLYISPPHRPPGYRQFDYFHPTFLYESLWDLAVFGALVLWLRPRLAARPGALFFMYIGLYSVGRFLIEGLRLDSFWLGQFRVAQLASVAGIGLAIIGLAWAGDRALAASDGPT